MFSAAVALVLAWSSSPQVQAMDVPSWVVPQNSLDMPFWKSIAAQGRKFSAEGRRLQDLKLSDECNAVCPTAVHDYNKLMQVGMDMFASFVVLQGNPAKFKVLQFLKENKTLMWDEFPPHGAVNVSDSSWDSVEVEEANGEVNTVLKERVERIEGADQVQLTLSLCDVHPGLKCFGQAGEVCENLPDGGRLSLSVDPQSECFCSCPKYLEWGMEARKEIDEGKAEGDVGLAYMKKTCAGDLWGCLQAEASCYPAVMAMQSSQEYAMAEECPERETLASTTKSFLSSTTTSSTWSDDVISASGAPAHATTALAMLFAMVPLMA